MTAIADSYSQGTARPSLASRDRSACHPSVRVTMEMVSRGTAWDRHRFRQLRRRLPGAALRPLRKPALAFVCEHGTHGVLASTATVVGGSLMLIQKLPLRPWCSWPSPNGGRCTPISDHARSGSSIYRRHDRCAGPRIRGQAPDVPQSVLPWATLSPTTTPNMSTSWHRGFEPRLASWAVPQSLHRQSPAERTPSSARASSRSGATTSTSPKRPASTFEHGPALERLPEFDALYEQTGPAQAVCRPFGLRHGALRSWRSPTIRSCRPELFFVRHRGRGDRWRGDLQGRRPGSVSLRRDERPKALDAPGRLFHPLAHHPLAAR